jgi:hypothetical protein
LPAWISKLERLTYMSVLLPPVMTAVEALCMNMVDPCNRPRAGDMIFCYR